MDEDIFNPENTYNHALKRRWQPGIKASSVSPPPRCPAEARAAAEALREVDAEIAERRRRLEAQTFLESL